ncbi:MAG: tripartite tricarboxylate transporter substrate binding protein [Betaproteobacteria bacterium]
MSTLFRLTLVAVLAWFAQVPAFAQAYPVKSVRIIVPFGPGGSADGVARPLAERLGAVLGQTFLVENRPGAMATIGATLVAKAEPDGYTLLLMPGTHVLAPRLLKSVPFNPVADFTPVSTVAFAPYAIFSARNLPFATLKDLVLYARENPEKLSVGISDASSRLALESMSQAGKFKLTFINYKGGGPITGDVVGGHLGLGITTPVAVQAFHKERKVTVLAITSPKRLGSMPDVPTVAEALGIAEFDSQTWFALAGPAGMPRAVVDRLQRAVAQIIGEPDMRDRLQLMGLAPAEDTTPESLATLMRTYAQRNAALMDAAKMTPE